MSRQSRQPIVFLVLLLLAACGSKGTNTEGPMPAAGETANVEVTNNNWLDMSIYAANGSKRVRLGTVTTMGTVLFEVPRAIMASGGSLQLIADPIGSRGSYVTESVNIWPGQTVQFRIENQLGISNVSVW
jgi:predicted small lipoprotein YifL